MSEPKSEVRYVMGIAACRIVTRYGKNAKIRNVLIELLEPYKWWRPGDEIVMPVRKVWRRRRK